MLARLQHIGRVQCRRLLIARALATGSATSPPASSATASASAPAPVPWFVDPQPVNPPQRVSPLSRATAAPPVPQDAPAVLKDLQAELVQSPHIDVSTLLVTQAVPPAPGPPLPPRAGQGKRNRGATFAGESEFQNLSGIWSWYMFVQVRHTFLQKRVGSSFQFKLGEGRYRGARRNRSCRQTCS